jgi:hypothetical protein
MFAMLPVAPADDGAVFDTVWAPARDGAASSETATVNAVTTESGTLDHDTRIARPLPLTTGNARTFHTRGVRHVPNPRTAVSSSDANTTIGYVASLTAMSNG